MQIARILIDRRINGSLPDGHPCHSLLPISNKDNVRSEIIQCSFLNNGAGCSLVKITNEDSSLNDENFVGNSISLYGECSVIKTGRNVYLATVMNNNCMLAQILSESGCFLTSAVPRSDFEIVWTLFAPNSVYISNFIFRLRSEGYTVKKISSESMDVDNSLTDKQEKVILYAYENGYYESPKKINIDDLCKEFDCSKSTMSVLLKAAEKKIIGLYFNINRQGHKIH